MGVLTVHVRSGVQGPLSSAEAEQAVQDWAENTAKRLGGEGADLLRAFPMNKTGRARGGFQANLHVLSQGPVARIPGPMISGVTWAPWLEGVSQRNMSTRFKGYHLFRQVTQVLRARAGSVGEAELAKILPRLGGA